MDSPMRQICLVCGALAEGTHFGVQACRACAMFFRRTTTGNRKYRCASISRNCVISSSHRNSCRSCRFQKCLTVGMLRERVRPEVASSRRPAITDSNTPSASNFSSTPQSSSVKHNAHLEEERSITTLIQGPAAKFLITSLTSGKDVISLFGEACSRLHQAILSQEEYVMASEGQDVRVEPRSEKDFRPVRFLYLIKMQRATLTFYSNFLKTTFKEYNSLPPDQRFVIFRHINLGIWRAKFAFQSNLIFRGHGSKRILMSGRTYCDVEDIGSFVDSMDATMNQYLSVAMKHCVTCVEAAKDLMLTGPEFAALLGISLFCYEIRGATPETMNVVRSLCRRLFDGLHDYYINELKLPNYAVRLGRAMSVVNEIKKFEHKLESLDICPNGMEYVYKMIFSGFDLSEL